MQRAHQFPGMGRTVEKIRIAERDMLCASRHLLADVGHHYVHRQDAKLALVHRHHRAMAAQMLAAARAFGETDDLAAALGRDQVRIARQRRQAGAVGLDEIDFRQTHHWLGLRHVSVLQPLHQRHQRRFHFTAEHRAYAQLAQQRLVHRRIQAINAQVRVRGELPDTRQRCNRNARGGVHRDIDSDQIGAGQHLGFEHLQRQIETLDLAALAFQPRGRLGQAERLAAEFVGIDQDDFHVQAIRGKAPRLRH